MSYIEPPTLTNLRKRKRSARSASVASSVVSHLPRDAIDPHSYGPSTRRQLVVAGLSHSDRLPADTVYEFPHRPLPEDPAAKDSGKQGDSDDDDIDTDDSNDNDDDGSVNSESGIHDTSDEDGEGAAADPSEQAARLAVKQRKLLRREARRRRNAHRMQRAYDQNVGVLAAVVQRGLQEAEHGTLPSVLTATGESGQLAGPIGLARAKRAFGLLLRTEVKGKPVDLRRNYLWAMGAELLMREGEGEGEGSRESGNNVGKAAQANFPRRWGSAANIARVRAFYEDLIQQHPYNRLWPRSVSALTFWPAMAGTEFYNIHAEAKLAMEQLDNKAKERQKGAQKKAEQGGSEDGDDDSSDDESAEEDHYEDHDHEHDHDDEHGFDGELRRRRNHADRLAREEIRREALDQARDLARRMDATMATAPYASSPEMLRLRGMLALFMADLAIVTPPRTLRETQEGHRLRAQERARARTRFARLLEVDRDIQTGRYHRKGGVPDTVVDEYIETMARGAKDDDDSSSGGEGDDTADYPAERPVFTSLPFR
ncbi:hypothetical protein SBRCBS47491_007942 [Sporothrix bragantina]|uniref:Uncharacterized protein n=1 Tax=Sporothrix bragantina TaxID=671064 RepID=A0ABP0CHE7_9PEZI